MRSIRRRNIQLVDELLSFPFLSLDTVNKDGESALHLASKMGSIELVLILLQAGANSSLRCKAGLKFDQLWKSDQPERFQRVMRQVAESNGEKVANLRDCDLSCD